MKKILLATLAAALCCNAFAGKVTLKLDPTGINNLSYSDVNLYSSTNDNPSNYCQLRDPKSNPLEMPAYRDQNDLSCLGLVISESALTVASFNPSIQHNESYRDVYFTISQFNEKPAPQSCQGNLAAQFHDNLDHTITISLNGCSVS